MKVQVFRCFQSFWDYFVDFDVFESFSETIFEIKVLILNEQIKCFLGCFMDQPYNPPLSYHLECPHQACFNFKN